MLYISWASDFSICDQKYSEKKQLSTSGVYHFIFDGDPVQISKVGDIEINLYLSPKSHCGLYTLNVEELRKGVEKYDISGHVFIKADYRLSTTFTPREGTHNMIALTLIEIRIHAQDDFIRNFYMTENHKIVSQIKVKRRTDMMNVRTMYLGRAQEIFTSRYGSYRRYVWTAGHEENTFKGIAYKSEEDLHDIVRIQKFHMVSPRGKKPITYIHDNDQFSNTNHALPIEFNIGEAITIQVFNLKFDPPKFVEMQIRYAEFSNSELRYEVVFDAAMQFVFTYHINESKSVVIDTITMRVKSYNSTLNNLGNGVDAKTV